MTKVVKMDAPQVPAVANEANAVLSMIDRVLANPDIPVERLEQLFNLHQRVQAETAKRAYYAAFAELQADLPAVARKGKAHNDKAYARFEDIIAAIREPLAAHGFSVSFRTAQPDGKLSVTGVLAHSAGHVEETTLTLPQDVSGGKNAVQAWGSSVSYGKRYAILTLLGIATEDDDDGKAGGVGATIDEKQFKELAALIKETGTDIAKFLEIGGLESLSDMPASQFKTAKSLLLKKKAAKA
jgi:cell fate (sporulation/competence/biofilm development) regulator YlbF (YheA/YmcA/DUF963 family)